MQSVAVVDFGLCNIDSIVRALVECGAKAFATRDAADLAGAASIVLPGVGAFPDCMRNLRAYGLIEAVLKSISSGKPFLGICLGLQLLFTESEEFGISKGLDIIKGRVVRFKGPEFDNRQSATNILKVPHMGWNSISIRRRPPALADIPDNSHVYFVHSFHVVPEDKGVIATTTPYGIEFVSSIWKDNVFAVQFHPEKSQTLGLSILKRFGEQKA